MDGPRDNTDNSGIAKDNTEGFRATDHTDNTGGLTVIRRFSSSR
jgi:hypothetical protein